MKLNREYQHYILTTLSKNYPDLSEEDIAWFENEKRINQDMLLANVFYLQEHGLLTSGVDITYDVNGAPIIFKLTIPAITVKGIDFIADDGGLSSILNVQTVKLHEETIKAFILNSLTQTNLSDQQKSKLSKTINNLKTEALKHLLRKLIDFGLSHAQEIPNLIDILQQGEP